MPDLQFGVDASSINSTLSLALAARIKDHSTPMSGLIDVSFGRKETSSHPYSGACLVQERMQSASTIRGAKSKQGRNLSSRISWAISSTDVPGNSPLVQFSSMFLDGKHVNSAVYVDKITDGGFMIVPLPADYFHIPAAAPQVHVWVNDGAARCALTNESACNFTFSKDLTPVIRSTQSQNPDGRTMYPTYKISG